MGYLRGLVHGALVGAALGLMSAPEAGVVTRRRLALWLGQVEELLAQGEVPTPPDRAARRRRAPQGGSENRATRP